MLFLINPDYLFSKIALIKTYSEIESGAENILKIYGEGDANTTYYQNLVVDGRKYLPRRVCVCLYLNELDFAAHQHNINTEEYVNTVLMPRLNKLGINTSDFNFVPDNREFGNRSNYWLEAPEQVQKFIKDSY